MKKSRRKVTAARGWRTWGSRIESFLRRPFGRADTSVEPSSAPDKLAVPAPAPSPPSPIEPPEPPSAPAPPIAVVPAPGKIIRGQAPAGSQRLSPPPLPGPPVAVVPSPDKITRGQAPEETQHLPPTPALPLRP